MQIIPASCIKGFLLHYCSRRNDILNFKLLTIIYYLFMKYYEEDPVEWPEPGLSTITDE